MYDGVVSELEPAAVASPRKCGYRWNLGRRTISTGPLQELFSFGERAPSPLSDEKGR
jgi:hypothetical protein